MAIHHTNCAVPRQIHSERVVLRGSFVVNVVLQETSIQHCSSKMSGHVVFNTKSAPLLTLVSVYPAHFFAVRSSFFCMLWMPFQIVSCPIPLVSTLVAARIAVLVSAILQKSTEVCPQWSPKSFAVCPLDLDSMLA